MQKVGKRQSNLQIAVLNPWKKIIDDDETVDEKHVHCTEVETGSTEDSVEKHETH